MANEEFLRKFLCSNCHAAIMQAHPTDYRYLKCPICGFTKEIKK